MKAQLNSNLLELYCLNEKQNKEIRRKFKCNESRFTSCNFKLIWSHTDVTTTTQWTNNKKVSIGDQIMSRWQQIGGLWRSKLRNSATIRVFGQNSWPGSGHSHHHNYFMTKICVSLYLVVVMNRINMSRVSKICRI